MACLSNGGHTLAHTASHYQKIRDSTSSNYMFLDCGVCGTGIKLTAQEVSGSSDTHNAGYSVLPTFRNTVDRDVPHKPTKVRLTCPRVSSVLLVSLARWKEMVRLCQCVPVAGESGWMNTRSGRRASAPPTACQESPWKRYLDASAGMTSSNRM